MTFAEHGLSVCHSCCCLVLNFIFPVFGFRFSLKKEIENSAHKTLARKHSAKKNLKPKCIPLDQLPLRHCLSSPPNLAKWPPLGLGMSRQSLASSSSISSPSSRTLSMNNACEDCFFKKHPTKMAFPIPNARLDPKMNWRAHLCFCKCCWISF